MNPQIAAMTILVTHWPIIVALSIRIIMRHPPVGDVRIALDWCPETNQEYDEAFTRQLTTLQIAYSNNSDQLDPEVWKPRPALRRFTENAFRLLGPLL